jgi:hypothetical protein
MVPVFVTLSSPPPRSIAPASAFASDLASTVALPSALKATPMVVVVAFALVVIAPLFVTTSLPPARVAAFATSSDS